MEKVRLGFIGCGGIVREHLNHGLKNFEDVEFVGWCDVNEKAARARKEQVGGRGEVFKNVETMLDQARPDAVYIMLPPFAHGPAERAVLERNLPFFVEKPVAVDVSTAREVAEAVRRRGLITSVGYMNRYRDSVQKVRRILQNQKPVLLHGGWLGGGPDKYEGIWEWWVRKDKSGGQFLEQTTHTTDLARYLFGEVETVFASAVHDRKQRPDFFTIEDASMVQLTFNSGAVAALYSSVATPVGDGIFLHVWGTEMKAEFTGWEHSVRIDLADATVQINGEPDIFAKEDRAFIDSVKSGKNEGILATYEDGFQATLISCAANESMKTGDVIRLSEWSKAGAKSA